MKMSKKWGIIAIVSAIGFTLAACENPSDELSGTLYTPVAGDYIIGNLIQTAGNVTEVTITPKAGKSTGTITIYYNGSNTLPKEGGTYSVTFDVAATSGYNAAFGLSAGMLIIIPANQNPVADDFNIGNLNQTFGNVTVVTISPKADKSTGAITIFYNGSTTLPTSAGTYAVTFNVAAVTGWNAATGLAGETLTINNSTPVASDFDIGNLTQTAGSVTEVTITPKAGKSTGEITIYYDSSTALPTVAGTYAVTFNVAASTNWNAAIGLNAGTLTINNQNPVATDFDIGNLTQTVGSVTAVTITPKAGKSTGEITIYYDSSTALPASAGTYAVTFNVAASTNWNAATGLNAGTLTINNQNPVVTDYDIGNLTQTVGSVTAVTITSKAGKSSGVITILYNGSTVLPTAAGTYTVTFNVAASTGWNAANDLSAGSLMILQTVSENRFEYYWIDQHGSLVTTSGGATTVTAGQTLTITALSTGYVVKQWHLNGLNTGHTGNTYNFSSTIPGVHTVGLFVEKDGLLYNTNIKITVQ